MPVFTYVAYAVAWLMVLSGVTWVVLGVLAGDAPVVGSGNENLPRLSPGQAVDVGLYVIGIGVAFGVLSEISLGIRKGLTGSES